MNKKKRINPDQKPYDRLLEEIKGYCAGIRHRREVAMYFYPKNRLFEGWSLLDVYERTQAAEQLGYDTLLSANDAGLRVIYKKKIKAAPIEWQ